MMPAIARHIGDIDYLVCAGYKHLLSPRGTAFLYVRESSWDSLPPIAAGWRAGDLPYGRYFGGPLQLAPDAARFNVSLAWFSWVGARESLRLLVEWQAAGAIEGVRAMAARLAAGLGIPDHGTTLVCAPIADEAGLARAVKSARIRASVRGGSLRLSPHLHNTRCGHRTGDRRHRALRGAPGVGSRALAAGARVGRGAGWRAAWGVGRGAGWSGALALQARRSRRGAPGALSIPSRRKFTVAEQECGRCMVPGRIPACGGAVTGPPDGTRARPCTNRGRNVRPVGSAGPGTRHVAPVCSATVNMCDSGAAG